jgi:hypothetical protein
VAASVDGASVVGWASVVLACGVEDGAAADPLGSGAADVLAAEDDVAPAEDDAAPAEDDVAPAEDDAESVDAAEELDDVVPSPATIPLSERTVWTCFWTACTWARISAGVASTEIASSCPRASLSFACSSADGCSDTVTTIW